LIPALLVEIGKQKEEQQGHKSRQGDDGDGGDTVHSFLEQFVDCSWSRYIEEICDPNVFTPY
jgi:hypothetical protein